MIEFCRSITLPILLLVCLVSCSSGEYDNREVAGEVAGDRTESGDFRSCIDGKCNKRTTQEVTSGMWFGPRLGRRRRSGAIRSEIDPDVEALSNMLENARWALITIPNDKRQTTTFTPRLGRESGEDIVNSYLSARDGGIPEENLPYLNRLLAARIVRRLTFSPSPRLGRQLRSLFPKY